MLRLVACGTHPVGTTQFVPYCGYHTICAHPVDEHKLWDLINYLYLNSVSGGKLDKMK